MPEGIVPAAAAEPAAALPPATAPSTVEPAAAASSRPTYVPPAAMPTQHGAGGARFDFNEGCRVMLPEAEHPWRVRISDLDTGNILFETEIKAGRVSSTKQY